MSKTLEDQIRSRLDDAVRTLFKPPILIGPQWLKAYPNGRPADFQYLGIVKVTKASGKSLQRVRDKILQHARLETLGVTVTVDETGVLNINAKDKAPAATPDAPAPGDQAPAPVAAAPVPAAQAPAQAIPASTAEVAKPPQAPPLSTDIEALARELIGAGPTEAAAPSETAAEPAEPAKAAPKKKAARKTVKKPAEKSADEPAAKASKPRKRAAKKES